MENEKTVDANQSESINELAAALSKAQGQIENAKKDHANPYFNSKYADLASVWEAIRKPITDNGLSVVQYAKPTAKEGILLVTQLMHASGQWIKGEMFMPAIKKDPQSFGSLMTYARRYSLMAICGIAPDDDDGEGAMPRAVRAIQNVSEAQQTRSQGPYKITEKQVKFLFAMMSKHGQDPEKVKQYVNDKWKKDITDLNKEEMDQLLGIMEQRAANG